MTRSSSGSATSRSTPRSASSAASGVPGTANVSAAAPAASPSPASQPGVRSAHAPPTARTRRRIGPRDRPARCGRNQGAGVPPGRAAGRSSRRIVETQHRRRRHKRRRVPIIPQRVADRADGRQRCVAPCPVIKIAALERMVDRQALEIELLKGALKHAPRPRSATISVITGPAASPSAGVPADGLGVFHLL